MTGSAGTGRPTSGGRAMRALRLGHRWLGLALMLPLAVQALTGSILALEPAIATFGDRPAAAAGSPGAAVQAARAVAPPGMRPGRYAPPGAAGAPALVALVPADRPRGASLLVRVDPATNAVLGAPEPSGGVMEWIKRLHNTWLIPELGGRQLAGWMGAGLLALLLLGIPLWWPRPGAWRDGFTVPGRARGARLQRRLHGAIGGWSGVLILVMGVTGVMQGFPQTTRALLGIAGGGPGGPGRGGPRGAAPAPAPTPDLDAALRLAQGAAPGLDLRFMFLPATAGEPVRMILGPPGTSGATTATSVAVSADAGRVLSVQSPATLAPGESVLRWVHDLHEGEGLGPAWLGLTVLAGAAVPAFGVTGLLLWLAKRRNRRRVADAKAQAMAAGD